MLLTCRANYPSMCSLVVCQQRILANIRQQCLSHPNITLKLRSALIVDQTIELDLKFTNFTFVGKLEMEIEKITILILLICLSISP